MIFPHRSSAPLPNPDLPNEIQKDFNEARDVLNVSNRGAAAILRLCIQKLCAHLGEKGRNVNEDIASLVAKGLPEKVQQALDVVRVVGNNAVHPGQLDIKDDQEIAIALFYLVNVIADAMITQPKAIQVMYDKLVPASQQAAITQRDKP